MPDRPGWLHQLHQWPHLPSVDRHLICGAVELGPPGVCVGGGLAGRTAEARCGVGMGVGGWVAQLRRKVWCVCVEGGGPTAEFVGG